MEIKEDLLTLKKLEADSDGTYKINFQELAELMYTYHNPNYETMKDYHKDFAKRELVINLIQDGEKSHSVFFAVEGTPPQGRAVFLSGAGDRACGRVVFLSPTQPPYLLDKVWLVDYNEIERRNKNDKR